MTKLTLSHSDQIVATLAKLPINTFGTRSTRDVALVIASCLNKAQDWAITLCVKTIAAKSAYSPRTVQRALKKLEEIDFFNVFRRKHPDNERFNFPSVYKLGSAVRSLFNQLVTTSRHGCQGKSLNSLNPLDPLQGQNYKKEDRARENVNNDKKKKSPVAKVDTARLHRTPEQWEARKQEAMAHNSNALEVLKRKQEEIQRQAASVQEPAQKPAPAPTPKPAVASPVALETNRNALAELKRRQAEIERQFNDPSPAAAYCNPFALGSR
ncbi:TPA: hypothetical protein I8303_001436 [Aeromonas hydrophila]|uniref:helix-turn-helix domain-containing protein n=1 Tax=Aeromonas hydrophila TaxID=644 RepID=UPI001181A29A|nr:helix-turn-helix domain-containing protein [Aeromonas hydrophila]WRK90006.1 helix-turn-helix domain-containing protein [Aeromonas hydrophila]HAT2712727.1 hypothetical protein [Aeromonas hydrophila]